MENNNYAIWELFLFELKRNISPTETEIRESLKFFLDEAYCNQDVFEKMVMVRQMASYEQTLIEHLHPPFLWKQSNIKAEILHLGTLMEAIVKILIEQLLSKGKILESDITKYSTDFPSNRDLTFLQLCSIFTDYVNKIISEKGRRNEYSLFLKDLVDTIHDTRKQRNKIHLDEILPSLTGEDMHEEYRVVKIRKRLDDLIRECKPLINYQFQ